MMWAWGYEPKSQARDDEAVIGEIGANQEEALDQAIDASFGDQAGLRSRTRRVPLRRMRLSMVVVSV